jgi:D-glycerate 3-kinase
MVNSVYTKQEEKLCLIPLITKLQQWHQPGKTVIVGIQGGQGTGKTTLGRLLVDVLERVGMKVTAFSIDDFYTSRRQRKILARKYPHNPYYQIARGMPGTHRVSLLQKTLTKIKTGKNFELPIFDKSLHQGAGDIAKRTKKVKGRQDFVFFEGWCLGAPKVTSKEFQRVCKKYKVDLKTLDPNLKFHKVLLKHVKDYQASWKLLDKMVMLQPDSSNLHLKWRAQQERELKAAKGSGMSPQEISSFVAPYLPLTYLCYEKVKFDVKILINARHKLYRIKAKKI